MEICGNCGSVAQSCLTLCNPMNCSMQASLSFTISWMLKLMSIESVMPSNHLIFCHPLFRLPSIFPSIRVFSNESVLCIRWPKYRSFTFSISPSSEYSGLISFSTDLPEYKSSYLNTNEQLRIIRYMRGSTRLNTYTTKTQLQ